MIKSKDGKVLEEYSDRQHILYVNGDWDKDDDLGKLMHDFHCARPKDMHFPLMAERLRYLKETEAGRMELVGLAAVFYKDGCNDTQRNNAERMLKEGIEPALIARFLAIPLEQVENVKYRV